MEKSVSKRGPSQNKAWVCDTCDKMYASNNLLMEHLNTHLGVRPYVCGICNKAFANKYTYTVHEKTHQAQPRPFGCDQCSKSFTTKQRLTYHKHTHSNKKDFPCDMCDKKFNSAHSLRAHSVSHSDEKPFACSICNKAFARKVEIKDHLRTHTGERPYQCELCGTTFSQRSNLQSHKRATHFNDKRFKCSICGEGFKRRRLLNYHIKAKHTLEKDLECEKCGVRFIYPDHLRKHRIIHTGLKPFVCEVCGKSFNNRDNKKAHLYVHSERKPYECMVCRAGFMRKKQLIQHIDKEKHPNDTILINPIKLKTKDEAADTTVDVTLHKNIEYQHDNNDTITNGVVNETEQLGENNEEQKEKIELIDVFMQDQEIPILVIQSEPDAEADGTYSEDQQDNKQILTYEVVNEAEQWEENNEEHEEKMELDHESTDLPSEMNTDDNNIATVNLAEEIHGAHYLLKHVHICSEDEQGNKQTLVDEAFSETQQQNINDNERKEVTEFLIQDAHGIIDLKVLFSSKEFQERYVFQNANAMTSPMSVEVINEMGEVRKYNIFASVCSDPQ